MNEVKTVELFAGIGGFRLGLERANQTFKQECFKVTSFVRCNGNSADINNRSGDNAFRIVWANEWDKYAAQIYRKNFGEKELYEGDITKVDADNIPDCDLIVGGFPCQSHSLAGKRKGFSDERGKVFYEIIRIAQAKRPKMLFLENVKGLLSSEQGKAFGIVLEELGNIGYWCEWQVINSKYHGVPQNRERVFIIGHRRGTSSRQIFPIIEGNGIFKTQSSGECREVKRKRADGNHMIREYEGQVQQQRIRRLTPVECERLQGFPDGWTEGVSDTQRYKCLGNAVTVNVIQAIGELILEACVG